jgi:hypothetical protein
MIASERIDRLAPPPPPRDIHESLAAYLELLDVGDMFLRAGLRDQLGTETAVEAAYRQWNRRQMDLDTRKTIVMLQRLTRSEGRNG